MDPCKGKSRNYKYSPEYQPFVSSQVSSWIALDYQYYAELFPSPNTLLSFSIKTDLVASILVQFGYSLESHDDDKVASTLDFFREPHTG